MGQPNRLDLINVDVEDPRLVAAGQEARGGITPGGERTPVGHVGHGRRLRSPVRNGSISRGSRRSRSRSSGSRSR